MEEQTLSLNICACHVFLLLVCLAEILIGGITACAIHPCTVNVAGT